MIGTLVLGSYTLLYSLSLSYQAFFVKLVVMLSWYIIILFSITFIQDFACGFSLLVGSKTGLSRD